MKRTLYSAIAILALMLGGCSQQGTAPAAKKEVKQAVPIGGQSGIFYMYQAARQWQNDAQILSVENVNLASVKAVDGKFGAWKGTFVSLASRQQKYFTYGVVEDGAIRKGPYAGSESIYAPKAGTFLIPIQKVKVDTTAALEVAQKQMKDVFDKNPGEPITFLMECTNQTTAAAWRVIVGPSLDKSKGSVAVNAETGKFIKKVK
jgi:hypothetical protein